MLNTTLEIMKSEMSKGGSQASVRGYVQWKSKEWSEFHKSFGVRGLNRQGSRHLDSRGLDFRKRSLS